jgi:hypothetical protein
MLALISAGRNTRTGGETSKLPAGVGAKRTRCAASVWLLGLNVAPLRYLQLLEALKGAILCSNATQARIRELELVSLKARRFAVKLGKRAQVHFEIYCTRGVVLRFRRDSVVRSALSGAARRVFDVLAGFCLEDSLLEILL